MSRSRWLLVAPAFALLATACGDDATTATATTTPPAAAPTTAPPDGAEVPPVAFGALVELYQPMLDELGLELTRGTMNDFETGPHLALYVVPTEASSPEQYLDRVVPIAAALEPALFERFPGLASFDICQEPVQADGREDEYPQPETLLLMTREQFESVPDWGTATLTDVLRAVGDGGGGESGGFGELAVSGEIERLPAWRAAEQAA